MRLLLVGAGASFSTKDVEVGLYDALRDAGVEVSLYLLDRRIGIAKRWVETLWRERGRLPTERPGWPDAIYRASVEALEMALRMDADWVLAISAMFLHPDALVMMRRAGLQTAIVFTESPYDDEKQAGVAGLVDVCWTNERTSVGRLRNANPATFYLRHAYDPKRHTPLAEADPEVASHDVVFVGTGWQERISLLSQVDWTGIDFGLYGAWPMLASRHRLRKHLRAQYIDNQKTAALYRQAKIGLNLHRHGHAESMNPRAYELAACGVFQLSDYRSELDETFEWAVPMFKGPAVLEQRIRYFLKSPAERQDKAQQARQRISTHTFAARAAQIVADLERIEAQPTMAKGA